MHKIWLHSSLSICKMFSSFVHLCFLNRFSNMYQCIICLSQLHSVSNPPHKTERWAHTSLCTSPDLQSHQPQPAGMIRRRDSRHLEWLFVCNLISRAAYLTVAKCSSSSPSSFLIFLKRLTTARQGPHHCWYTSTTDTHTHTHTHTQTHTHRDTHTRTQTRTRTHTHTHTHTHRQTDRHTHTHTRTQTRTHTHTHFTFLHCFCQNFWLCACASFF